MRILSVILLLIAYGSLYPGNFSAPRAGTLQAFLTNFTWFTSIGDVLGNIALFFPLGIAAVLFSSSRRPKGTHFGVALLLAFIFSLALQLAQVWLPSRTAALADVLWNMVGMASGMTAANLVAKRVHTSAHSLSYLTLIPLSILVLWLLNESLPLAPTLDWQKIKDALKPLLEFNFSLPKSLMHAAGVVAAGTALMALRAQPALWLGGALIVVLAAKLIVVNLYLDASALVGMVAGYVLFASMLRLGHSRRIFEAAFWLMLIAWTAIEITPFFLTRSGTINIIPFATMLHGSMESGAHGLVRSLFIYTALLWLGHKNGMDTRKTIVGLVIWSCLIELSQMALLGRTADVTEPILLMLVGWALGVVQRHQPQVEPVAETTLPQLDDTAVTTAKMSGRRTLTSIALGMAIWVAIAWLVTRSELTPYNVRELVYQGHPFRSLVLLATLFYWSIGFPVFIARWLTRGGMYLLSFLPLVLLHGLVAWLLIVSAVPSESIHDIVGSPVLGWPWKWELLGRFLALFCIWSVAATAGSILAATGILPHAKTSLLGWVIGACLVVPVSYYVVVSQASTDNLVELIANNGSLGSFLLIGSALVLLLFGGAKVALAFSLGAVRADKATMWVLGAGVSAYLALHFGLEQIIVKYGQVFSALQFLLSSNRENLAGTGELIVRYAILYSGLLAAIVMVQGPLWRWVILAPRHDRIAREYLQDSTGSSHTPSHPSHFPTSDQ
ncbi:VanZ family protein [Nitrosospira sp. Is2]|uniref:VanZ family protein n=1 Tax=Nitrosospira sp. Is2 TaxID=3080532 RepID=UPI002952FEF4|nr:VanZ family protein [Nitrosospira sp. Is2]WON72695.1 VanZ family protein [Nitrosospira sp. Is2]